MRPLRIPTYILCALGLTCLPEASRAGTNLLTKVVQASGANWTAAIWQTNNGSGVGVGAAVAPIAGNAYEMAANTLTIGNGVNSTRVRNPAVAGVQTFPGDLLLMDTNTELRGKGVGAILNFPGVGGNPGLILNGGMLNGGDDTTFGVTGRVQVLSQSYISHGANGGGGGISANRGFNFTGFLTGPGNMVILNSGTTTAQQVSGITNTFSGQWIVQCGLLVGNTPNSLGTNSITIDPSYNGYLTSMPNVTSPAGPAVFEPKYDLNSAGVLTLTNGGTMRLHQICIFSAVNIENGSLSPGIHFYSELITNFATSFAAGGSGGIIVRPYDTNPPALGPSIVTQPSPEMVYAGVTAQFTVSASANGAPPLTYRWQRAGTNLIDGGNISGSATNTLIVSNVSAADAVGYDVVVGNQGGSVTSTVVALTVVAPSGEAYEAAVLAAHPVAFYQLNETGDPATNNSPAFDFAGGFVGTYGNTVQNGNPAYGVAGPLAADGFSGFAAGNKAATFTVSSPGAKISVLPWNMNTNTVTMTAWINPTGPQIPAAGLVFCRNGTGAATAGFNYSSGVDLGGNFTLGYNWNDESDTYNWSSGLAAPPGQWSLVALVVTPTNATIYVINTNGAVASVHVYNHIPKLFTAATLIGDDSFDGGNGARAFNGVMDDVAIFNSALSAGQLLGLYAAAAGSANFAPIIGVQPPASTNLYQGQTVLFRALAAGTLPLTYQWQGSASGSGIFTNIADGGQFSGSASSALTIANLDIPNSADYRLVVGNSVGSVTSSVVSLTVSATNAAENITMSVQEAAGADWETGASWSDGNPASISAAAKPGSTYELLAGSRLRSPVGPVTATFPGSVLTVDGDGIWNLNPAAGATIAEIRFKQSTYGDVNGTVNFKKLVMNGGQLDAGADAGGNNNTVVIGGGEVDILTNAPINGDNTTDRGYLINSQLKGPGSIEYHAYNQPGFQPSYTNNLNIAGTSNTFSGKWNIVIGTLLGTGTNSLGTNDINVGPNGALETTYNVNNPNGSLFLSGRMYLHQDDTFRSLIVGGLALAPGTYTFAQLNTAYPTNFPTTWTPQNGATSFLAGSGSITVLVQAGPTITTQPLTQSRYPTETVQLTVAALGNPPLGYRWRKAGVPLTDTGNLSGTTTTNLTITNLVVGNAGDYTVVVTNPVGSVTSIIATLTVLPTGPAENITMAVAQPQNSDWNTPTDWSDGLSATISSLAKPGSTYEVLPQALMRTPAAAADSTFPGVRLTVDGDGVWANGGSPTIAEVRFKHAAPGTVHFKQLVMAGGQLDTGDNGVIVVAGEMDILANTPIYADSAAGQDRPYQIDAWLTGNGSIEYHDFSTNFAGGLNITGTSNTFSGTWNVVQGVLLGTGTNSLGTNTITVAATGALETLYDIHNNNGSLVLDGQVFLHQNDTFQAVTVAGVPLAAGTYTFAQLNAAYPANFPATWPLQQGTVVNTGSGSITVLGGATRPKLQVVVSGSQLSITWPAGFWLIEATDVTGPWTTNAVATSPFTVNPTGPRKFYGLQPQ